MTLEDKELLLRDLCGRLPYGVKGERVWVAPISGSPESGIHVFDTFDINVLTTGYYDCGKYGFKEVRNYSFKPYLFPLSSMTEEQKKEWRSLMTHDSYGILYPTIKSFDYLYKNHIDIRGLIPMGLAIDCTNLNIY